jgi:hypothetical protein
LEVIVWLTVASKVCPSGTERATFSAPIKVPPPALLSMSTGCPHRALSSAATARIITSMPPPAGNGTTMRTAFVGKLTTVSASAGATQAQASAAAAVRVL